MTRLSIDLPEDVKRRLEARAARAGHMNVESYVQALLTAEAEEFLDNYAGPPHLTFRTDAELEAILLDRLNDTRPDIEATPEFWEDFERRAEARRRKGA